MDIGEAGPVGVSYVGMTTAVWVRALPSCKVFTTTKPVRFWLIVWVDMPGATDRLQAERTVTSERNMERNLNVFNFAFVIATKINSVQFNSHEFAEIR